MILTGSKITEEVEGGNNTFGKIKLVLCQRLGDKWHDLADYLGIPTQDQACFEKGYESRGIWVWLENRQHLDRLPEALTAIDRQDLAKDMPLQSTSKDLPKETREDWEEQWDVSEFYGRTEQINMLKQWIIDDHCRLVAVLGMGGMGKTALAMKFAKQVLNQFDHLIWRTLRNARPIEEILTEWIKLLSNPQQADIPESPVRKITVLLDCLRRHRCLLILDNIETALQENEYAGLAMIIVSAITSCDGS